MDEFRVYTNGKLAIKKVRMWEVGRLALQGFGANLTNENACYQLHHAQRGDCNLASPNGGYVRHRHRA